MGLKPSDFAYNFFLLLFKNKSLEAVDHALVFFFED